MQKFNEWSRIWLYEASSDYASRYTSFKYPGYVRVLDGVANGYGKHLWLRRKIAEGSSRDGLFLLDPFNSELEKVENLYQNNYPDLSLKIPRFDEVGLQVEKKVVLSVETQERMIAYCEVMRQYGITVTINRKGLLPCVSTHQEEIAHYPYLALDEFSALGKEHQDIRPELLSLALKEIFQYKKEAVLIPLRDMSQGIFDDDGYSTKLDPLMIGISPDACAFIGSRTSSIWL